MKVTDILKWIIEEGIDPEFCSIIDVTKEHTGHTNGAADFVKTCFGGVGIGDLRAGTYFFFYLDQVKPSQVAALAKKGVTPDSIVLTEESVIFLYFIEYDLEAW